jgi:hypothetical protein
MKISLENINFEKFYIWRRNKKNNDVIQDDNDDVNDDYHYYDYDDDDDRQKPCSEESRLKITDVPVINLKQQVHQRHIIQPSFCEFDRTRGIPTSLSDLEWNNVDLI